MILVITWTFRASYAGLTRLQQPSAIETACKLARCLLRNQTSPRGLSTQYGGIRSEGSKYHYGRYPGHEVIIQQQIFHRSIDGYCRHANMRPTPSRPFSQDRDWIRLPSKGLVVGNGPARGAQRRIPYWVSLPPASCHVSSCGVYS